MVRIINSLARDRAGNIAISAAAALPLLVGSLALGVDYGNLTLQRREAQNTADLAAIVAASDPAGATAAVGGFLQTNGLDYVIATDDGHVDPQGRSVENAGDADGVVTIETGRYRADQDIAVDARFVAGAEPANAARVTVARPGTLHFASLFTSPPDLSAVGTAHAPGMAAFSIGSRLVSLEGGVLNAVLGSLLGTELSLKAMDYRALLDADVSLLSFFDALATRLDLTGVSYDQLLRSDASIAEITAALATTDGLDGGAQSLLLDIAAASRESTAKLPLGAFFDAGPLAKAAVGSSVGTDVRASVLDILSAAGTLANGENQIALDLDAGLPGLLEIRAQLAIGEPPQGSAWIALGESGTTVRTAQTRLKLDVKIGGRGAISLVHLPLYVEIAYGEAVLADIRCAGGGAEVALDARPGIVEAAIGEVSPHDFADFNREPRVDKARLVDLLLLRAEASAHFEATDMTPQRVLFSSLDIADGAVKSVATRDVLQSLTTSLLERLDLEVDVLGLSLLSPRLLQDLLADILADAAAPLDRVLATTLRALGIRIGEADLRVTGATCGRPVLVQ